MIRFLFTDGDKLCEYSDGAVTVKTSKFIEKYRENAVNVERAKSWKHSGEGAKFRGDVIHEADGAGIASALNGIYPLNNGESAYSFTVDGTSGIYKTVISDEKGAETHVINSLDEEFYGGCADADKNVIVCSVRRNAYNSDIAVFDLKHGGFKSVTDGDTLDEYPFVCGDGKIIFVSRGAGRDGNGAFVKFSNTTICRLDTEALTVEELAADEKYNYIKPVYSGGKLYAVRLPAKEKKPNPVVEILLIPFRIVQAIVNFINVFVTAFTGKSLASGGENPAKGRDYDSRKEFVKGNLINCEKEIKKNARADKNDYGFIPRDWKLVEVESGKVLASGVADFDILPDGTVIYTNGRRVFAVKDGKKTKLCNAERCLNLACVRGSDL